MSNVLELSNNDDALLILDELRQLTSNATQIDRRIKMLKSELVSLVGDADEFVSSDGIKLASFKTAKDSIRFDEATFREQYSELYGAFKTKVIKGARRLIFDKFWGGV